MNGHPQGLIAPATLVSAARLETRGDRYLLAEAGDFAFWAAHEALSAPGEYPREAQWANAASYYLVQVENGGHGQFVFKSGPCRATLEGIGNLLAAADFPELHAIFREFVTLIESPEARAAALEAGGFEGTPDELTRLDRRFFSLCDGDAKRARLGDWARRLPRLRWLSVEKLNEERPAVLSSAPIAAGAGAPQKQRLRLEDPPGVPHRGGAAHARPALVVAGLHPAARHRQRPEHVRVLGAAVAGQLDVERAVRMHLRHPAPVTCEGSDQRPALVAAQAHEVARLVEEDLDPAMSCRHPHGDIKHGHG
ncbi:hypothetical protein [Falsiroseomonas sp.]|uniref:DMP19 family protein n=1 Tax=Falsiroseomonas sp. TaxID=2870721 RepID=UPI00356400AD